LRRLRVIPRDLRTAGGPVRIAELVESLRSGLLIFTGLPWTGKTVAALWVASQASESGIVFHVSHKKSALAGRAYNVEEWILEHGGGSSRIVTLSLDPNMPGHVYNMLVTSAVAALQSWEKGSIDPLALLLERHSRPGLASRLRSRIRAWTAYTVLSGVLDVVLTLTAGLGVSTLASLAKSISSLTSKEGVRGVPIVLDDLEVLDHAKRSGLIETLSGPAKCRNIIMVRAIPPGESLPGSGGDPEAFLYIQSIGLATQCTPLEGAARRLVIVQPDLELTAGIARELGSLVDPERVARESHGLPGVAVARLMGGMLEAMGSSVERVEDLIAHITGRTTLQEPLAPLLSQGGPLWADTAATVARALAVRILEASRSPATLQGLSPAERGRLRLRMLELANKLAVQSLLGEYAPSTEVTTARVASDGRLLIMLREELGDFLFSAVPATVDLRDTEGRMLAALLAEAPRAVFEEVEKSNPLLDLFTVRLAYYAATKNLGDYGEYYRIYAVSLTSLLLNTPGLAIQAPVLEPPPVESMDEPTAVAALKLAYQLYESSINNPGLIASLSGLGLEKIVGELQGKGGLVGLLAIAARAARARLEDDIMGAVEAANAALRAEAVDCASTVAKARILLETASTLLEAGVAGEGRKLLREAIRAVESLPRDPGECEMEGLELLYYPNRSPETLYEEDIHELRAYAKYLNGHALLLECDAKAPQELLAAAVELAKMYALRPYYVLHNMVTTLHKAIQATALLAPNPCNAEVALELPGDRPTRTVARGVHRAQWALYEHATRYPGTMGEDVLDALYVQYTVLSHYCGEQPKPPRHNLGERGKVLLARVSQGACPPPACERRGLEALGCT